MITHVNNVESILESWQKEAVSFIPEIILAIIVFILFYLLAKLIVKLSKKFFSRVLKRNFEITKIISSIIYFLFLFSGTLFALQILGLEKVVTKILSGAGIIGIVAGFAFKDIASNVFAGFLLSIQSPFKKGDWVLIDGAYGTVNDIGWLTTTINTVPGQEVFVPNQIIYSNTFTNFSTFQKRRIVLETGVSYGDDLNHVKDVALDEIKKIPELLTGETIDFYYTNIGSSSYNFQLRFWIKFKNNDDYQKAVSDAIISIKNRFAKEKISIAYNVTTLDFGVKGGVNLFDNEIKILK